MATTTDYKVGSERFGGERAAPCRMAKGNIVDAGIATANRLLKETATSAMRRPREEMRREDMAW